MPTGFLNSILTRQNNQKPNIQSDWIKDWTQDPNRGDKFYTGEGSGQGWYPIWKTQSEMAQNPIDTRAKELTDPNSAYYKSIGKQLTSQLTGAYSPDSLLALTVAMGGSPAQAQQQMKAQQGRISDTAGSLLNNYYLNASSQANQLYGMGLQNAQFNQNINFQKDMYAQQKQDSLLNTILGGTLGIGGNLLGGLFGKTTTTQQPTQGMLNQFSTGWF